MIDRHYSKQFRGKRFRVLCATLWSVALCSVPALADGSRGVIVNPLIVTTIADNGDNSNPTGGSLRAAIVYANSHTGADTITFNIPLTEGTDIDSSGGGDVDADVFVIHPPVALPGITDDGTTIDGTTQQAFGGDTNPAGPEIVLSGDLLSAANANGLSLYAANGVVKSVVVNGFYPTFDGGGKDSTGIYLSGDNNRIEGCYIGTDATGTTGVRNWFGLQIFVGANNVVGGTTADARNVISGNATCDVYVTGLAYNNVIQGNYIGPAASGADSLANLAAFGGKSPGILVDGGAHDNRIGGTTPAQRNIISGNSNAVRIFGVGTSGNKVLGNFIGTKANGTEPLPNTDGVVTYYGASNNLIGGLVAGAGNRIAFNVSTGVYVGEGTGNAIRHNEIFANGALGIDLVPGSDGVTLNDTSDSDTGPNNLQNFPVITRVRTTGAIGVAGAVGTIQFMLNSAANRTYAIDFFRSPTADSSGYGEGAVYVGSKPVTTDADGNVSASLVFSGIPGGSYFTATATDTTTNDTSEFSQAVTPPLLQFSAATYAVAENGGSFAVTVTRTGDITGAVAVNYAVSGGTLNFAANQVSRKFTITIADDTLDEANETINLSLSTPTSGAALGEQSTAILTIVDNDAAPTISISDVTVTEGNGGTATPRFAVFTVSLSAPSAKKVTVQYRTVNLTATAPEDYAAIPATSTDPVPVLTFLPGQETKNISVPINGDTIDEANEKFQGLLFAPVNAVVKPIDGTLTDRQGIGTITDDDGPASGSTSLS
jgi:hypothetical protein